MNIAELEQLRQKSISDGIDPIVYFRTGSFWYTAKLSHIGFNLTRKDGKRIVDIRDGAEVDIESLTCDENVVILDKLKTGRTIISLTESAPYYYNFGSSVTPVDPWGITRDD